MIGLAAQLIATRARQQVGTPFKLHGRSEGKGLDCVGLIAHAIAPICGQREIPRDYMLRGDFSERTAIFLEGTGLRPVAAAKQPDIGDILLAQAGPRQQHLMIMASDGLVHAHAGLRRVVLTPWPSPWKILHIWRAEGD